MRGCPVCAGDIANAYFVQLIKLDDDPHTRMRRNRTLRSGSRQPTIEFTRTVASAYSKGEKGDEGKIGEKKKKRSGVSLSFGGYGAGEGALGD